jgi:hypothetical protein
MSLYGFFEDAREDVLVVRENAQGERISEEDYLIRGFTHVLYGSAPQPVLVGGETKKPVLKRVAALVVGFHCERKNRMVERLKKALKPDGEG